MTRHKGIFVSFEGIDNAGKTEVGAHLCERLRAAGHQALLSKEFTTPIGALLKSTYIAGPHTSPELKVLLFAADRLERQHNVIVPALSAGAIVIADRWTYSAFAYRRAEAEVAGADASALLDYVDTVNRRCMTPDLQLYLDISVSSSMARQRTGDSAVPSEVVLKGAREAYLSLVRGGKLTLVDASRSVDAVVADIESRVLTALG